MDAKGNIEVWLQRLVDGMQGTVKASIKKAVRNVYVSVRPALGAARCKWRTAGRITLRIQAPVAAAPCPAPACVRGGMIAGCAA